MTRDNMMEAMNGIGDHLIVEAAEKLGFLSDTPMARKPKGQSAFSRFMNSGWGVAAVCALVAVSVMGGIIWAGQQAGQQPPVETSEETTMLPEDESEGIEYIGEDQTDISVKCGDQVIYPRSFLVFSGPADGLGFYETVQAGALPMLPTIYSYRTPFNDNNELIIPETHELKRVTLYDKNMEEVSDGTEKLCMVPGFEFGSLMACLMPGRYYLSLYVETENEAGEVTGRDYAFEIRMQNTADDIVPGQEANEYQKTWVALREKLLSEGEPYKAYASNSGLDLPDYERDVRKWYETKSGKFVIMLGVDTFGNVVMTFDYYKALVVLTLQTDGSMEIRVRSEGNYHCRQMVNSPTEISERFLFYDNEWYQTNEDHDAPLYYTLYGMHYMDEVMGELGETFSFEALGYIYADYQDFQYRLYS